MKGIIITRDNQSKLGQQYNVDPADFNDVIPLGYILVADFGDDFFHGVMTQVTFDTTYIKGPTIQNTHGVAVKNTEFFEVTLK